MSVAQRLCNQSLLMRGRSPDNIFPSGLFITSWAHGVHFQLDELQWCRDGNIPFPSSLEV